ncbi:TonB-dependent receptor [Novosphingobium sp.]|uniref:TonB-dependent receptor n=1 Tax=Novosphingobium sp. TaxID=1874826 RepID=UPI0031DA9D0D
MSSALVALCVAIQPMVAAAQSTASATQAPKADAENKAAILVLGVRGSLKTAAAKKKDAKQIVDSVVAEDAGKLPDNNVVEALARVTGVQIERQHGEGSSLTIRGMGDISTTVNGQEANSGDSRSMSLSNIPAELLKSVEVYKTRTADQIEGGIGGTVNVELRRPLDLKKGWTGAASFREVFSDIGNTKSPYASALIAKRMDTASGGEFGFLINASYTRNHYNETFVESESPDIFVPGTKAYGSLPASKAATTVLPYAVNYGVEQGVISRPSVNAVLQWKPSPKLDFVLEGQFFSSSEKNTRDRLHLVLRDDGNTLTNLGYGATTPSGYNTLQSLTLTPAAGTLIDGGPEAYGEKATERNYNLNFETHFNTSHTHIKFSAQYAHSRRESYFLLSTYRLPNATSATVDLDSSQVPGGGPFVTFNGVNLTDPSQYVLYNFHDQRGVSTNNQYAFALDLTQDLSEGFFKSLQMGTRFANRKIAYRYGYRDSFPRTASGGYYNLSNFNGVSYSSTTPDYAGAPSWYHLDANSLWDNLAAIKSSLVSSGTNPATDWSTAYPGLDLGSGYASIENTFAVYAQMNYGFKIGNIPVDGVAGARIVNTWGTSSSAQYAYDVNWNQTITQATGRGNFIDVLPSINAIVHFSPKTQLRLAYTQNVQRADFNALSPFRIVQAQNNTVYAGNPDLKAYTEKSFDISLEHYFGRGGQVSLGGYYKLPKGYIYYDVKSEYIPELNTVGSVWKNRNAGDGTFGGIEFTAQSFFDFLPKDFRNFGASFNTTYLAVGKIEFPDNSDNNALNMSHLTLNAALYYDTPKFSTRISWNYRSRYRTYVLANAEYSPYIEPTSRLDMAINYTPLKFMTISLEASNLLKNNMRETWGNGNFLPQGVRFQARTFQVSARVRM